MNASVKPFIHKMVLLLVAIIVLQFAGANLGAHQLHAGNSAEEAENHPHLQFSAEVTSVAQCIDCACPAEHDTRAAVIQEKAPNHTHLVSTSEIQEFDLCLDCQCHGGHVALLTYAQAPLLQAFSNTEIPFQLAYRAPDNFPKYRPPIA